MSHQTLIKTWYYRRWNQWDKAISPKILSENLSFRGSLGQEKKGYAGLAEYMDLIRAAFPDLYNEIELISSGRD